MKKVFLSALFASSTLVILANSALAKECPPLNVDKITVYDPDNNISLRTDTATEKQEIPGSNGGKAVINDQEILLIYEKADPKDQSEICFYPVQLNETNNRANKNQSVLNFKPYWISEKGIRDYSTLVAQQESQTQSNSNSASASSEQNTQKQNTQNSLFPWQFIVIPLLLLAGGLGIFKLSEWNKKNNYGRGKKKNNKSTPQGNYSGVTPGNTENPTGQQIQSEAPGTLSMLLNVTSNVERQVDRNTNHIKKVEELLTTQNELIRQLIGLIKNNSFSQTDVLNAHKQFKEEYEDISKTTGESLPVNQNQSEISATGDQSETSQQESQQDDDHDLFYDEVIENFNHKLAQWFSSGIENTTFKRVRIPQNFMYGHIDANDGQTTQLELHDQGQLLVYEANKKHWVIPDPGSRWANSISGLIFLNRGQALIRPAEVKLVGDSLWQLVEKGEFRD